MSMTLEQAAEAMRNAMRETVRRHSTWYLVQGGLMAVAGVVALLYPAFSSFAVVVLLGWLLIVSGVAQSISLIGAQQVPHFWLQLVSVVLSFVVGFLLIAHPGEGLFTITLLLIVFFAVEGMARIVFSLTIRPFPNWGWVCASGVVTLALAFLLWGSLPVSAVWLLGVMVGINLMVEGIAMAWLAWQVRQETGAPKPA